MSELLVFIGRPYTRFSDNLKYAFLSYLEYGSEFQPVYVTGDSSEFQLLETAGLPVIHYEADQDLLDLTHRIGLVVSDSHDWRANRHTYNALYKAPFINLWHGLPLKRVGLFTMFREDKEFDRALYASIVSTGADAYVSTSDRVTEDIWKKSFHALDYPKLGYARNDVLFRDARNLELLNVDGTTSLKMKAAKAQGKKVAIYCPTFRELEMGFSLNALGLDLEVLEKFCEDNNMELHLKLHPIFPVQDIEGKYQNINVIDNKSDMYPLFRHSDVLITDYSSIFFDYLLLDRPIIHFAADLDSYRFRDRGFSYRFEEVRCGPVCSNLSSLMSQLARLDEGDKEYAQTRARIRNYMHELQDMDSGRRFVEYADSNFVPKGHEQRRLSLETACSLQSPEEQIPGQTLGKCA